MWLKKWRQNRRLYPPLNSTSLELREQFTKGQNAQIKMIAFKGPFFFVP